MEYKWMNEERWKQFDIRIYSTYEDYKYNSATISRDVSGSGKCFLNNNLVANRKIHLWFIARKMVWIMKLETVIFHHQHRMQWNEKLFQAQSGDKFNDF